MSEKIINNLKVHAEDTTNKYTDAEYNELTERISGSQAGTPISSKLLNTSLRQSTLVVTSLIEALKNVVDETNDLTNEITVGTDTTLESLTESLTQALLKIKVNNATLADNVKSGAIVEETDRARESKQGFPLSLEINDKLKYNAQWVGTHRNGDIVYYDKEARYRGFYVVNGLPKETKDSPAGTVEILASDTPGTRAYFYRLTYETDFGMHHEYNLTDNITPDSTSVDVASAKGVYNRIEDKFKEMLPLDDDNKILMYSANEEGLFGTLDKITSIGKTSTNTQIPTGIAVYNCISSFINDTLPAGSTNKIITQTPTAGKIATITITNYINDNTTTHEYIPTALAVSDFIDSQKEILYQGSLNVKPDDLYTYIDFSKSYGRYIFDYFIIEWDLVNDRNKPFTSLVRFKHDYDYATFSEFIIKGTSTPAMCGITTKLKVVSNQINAIGFNNVFVYPLATGASSNGEINIIRIIGVKQ